jgi:predicted SAM-dependent methyltransferase
MYWLNTKSFKVLAGFIKKKIGWRRALKTFQDRGDKIILDIGGVYSLPRKSILSDGTPHPVWREAIFLSVNIDFRVCPVLIDDAVSLKLVPDRFADGIFSSHTIEHIMPKESKLMFRNWHRVLRPGGRAEIRCPDIAWAWEECVAGRLPEEILPEIVLGISEGKYQVHRNVYWESKLRHEMRDAGFTQVRRIHNNPEIPGLDNWTYDGQFHEFHGVKVKDLLMECYKQL